MEKHQYKMYQLKYTNANMLIFTSAEISNGYKKHIENAYYNADLLVFSTIIDDQSAYYNPITLDISFATFGGFVVKQETLDEVGGLDESLGEAAATDLVIRLKVLGKTVKYLPSVDTFEIPSAYTTDKTTKYIDNIQLIAKHGTKKQYRDALIQLLKAIKHPDIYSVSRKALLKGVTKKALKLISLRLKRTNTRGTTQFYGIEYGFFRGRIPDITTINTPLVSIVIRTYNRASSLMATLKSLTNQLYNNFEVIVVEDSVNTVEQQIMEQFPELNIRYHTMGKNTGRAKAAAKGIELAKGKYINLLDDDDYLFPEYLTHVVSIAEKENPDIVFSSSVALEIDVTSIDPYEFIVKNMQLMEFPNIDIYNMIRQCLVASNAVLFRKDAYIEVGGIREDLDANEDWSLWLLLMTRNNYSVYSYAAACFTVPYSKELQKARIQDYRKSNDKLLEDENLTYNLTAKELQNFYNNHINDLMYLKQHKLLDSYIDKEFNNLQKK